MSTEDDETKVRHIPLPPPTPGRIRSHSLKPQHSRIDYARRKSASELSCAEFSIEHISRLDEMKKSPSASSWLKRRFTFFSLDQQPMQDKRQSIFDERSYSDLLRQKRPSIMAQMMEVEKKMMSREFLFFCYVLKLFLMLNQVFCFVVICEKNFFTKEKTQCRS